MRKLGRGWQYTTYDVGNGRVLKKYNSLPIAYLIMLRDCFPYIQHPIWKIPSYFTGCKETARDSMRKLPHATLAPWMFGNPEVLNDLDYSQDKLLPLLKKFRTSTVEEGRKVIDSFVEFNELLVSSKLIDKSFNITKNFGMDAEGRVVLVDLGELYSSDAAIKRQIEKRAWASFYVVKDLPARLRSYFVESMDKAFQS